MRQMKKTILITVMLAITLFFTGTLFSARAVNVDEMLNDALETDKLERALPESAESVLGSMTVSDGADYKNVFNKIWTYIRENGGKIVKSAFKNASAVLIIAIFTSTVSSVFNVKNDYIVLAGIAAISAFTVSNTASFIAIGKETLSQLSAFSKALLPTLASASAMGGAYTSSGAKFAVSIMFIDILITCGEQLIIPIICAYIAAGIGNAALGGDGLASAAGFLKWLAVTMMTVLMIAFTAFLSVTGVISGSVDAVTQRVAKTAISTVLPVVGSIVSDAAGTMAAGVGILKNAVGVFGMAAVLAVCAIPFLKIGAAYLAYKASAGLAGTIADSRITKLMNIMGTAFGMILGLVGSVAAMVFVSVILFMKAVV